MNVRYPRSLGVRLTEVEYNLIQKFCQQENWFASEFIRNAVRALLFEYVQKERKV